MKKNILLTGMLIISVMLLQKGYAQREFVQPVLIDSNVKAGKLILYPTLNDPNKFFYLPNKIRLAKDDNGQDKFLFLYYVTNVSSGDAEEVAKMGKTGGYVHLVVGLQVLPEELEEARQDLKKNNPRGVIVGPVSYRGGTMSLVTKSVITNSANPDPNQKRVLGVGPAPSMDGDYTSVSFILDSMDAKIMWESLQMSSPDIGFNFDMVIGGYQSPVSFRIDMDWDKIYKHKIFNAGLATPILKAEVGIAAQELKESAGIKITTVGEDPNLQKLQDVITNKLLEMCFVPFGSEGSPNWAELAKPLNDGKSYLDRASEQLALETANAERRNKDVRENNTKERQYTDEENRKRRAENDVRRKAAEERADRLAKEAEAAKQKAKAEPDPIKRASLDKDAAEKVKLADNAQKQADTTGGIFQGLLNAFAQPSRAKPAPGTDPNALGPAFSDPKNYKSADKPIEDIPMAVADIKKEEELPKLSLVASYQQKSVRHSGHYIAEAKTFFTTSRTEHFGDKIGKVNCRDCIKKINTWDALAQQRELVCFLDGEIAGDFNNYINYVTVMMRKKHAGGDITGDEVRIDRRNFNLTGNRFKLAYGWMTGDDNRKTWSNYEYKTTWNFFGGATIEKDWQAYDQPVIPLSPPVAKYTVNFVADPETAKANNIRGATLRIFYKVGGVEMSKQQTMDISKGVSSVNIDYLLPKGEFDYEYQVEWLKGTTPVKSARIKTSQTMIKVDEIIQ